MSVGDTDDTQRTDVGERTTPAETLFDRIAAELTGAAPDEADDASPAVDADASPRGILIDASAAWPAPDVSTQMSRPLIADRQCSRTGCADVAAVTLSYHYGHSQVWIDHLTPEREPHSYDMCERHAERLSVPQGWHLDDRRGARRSALIAV